MKMDIKKEEGQLALKKMLHKYLEGLQWVLFYYYKGVQHWRWYYPYHYAPLISDLGQNIVNTFLQGKNTI
jgi:5'-3' exoribonuclease 1